MARFRLRQARNAIHAAPRERAWTRSTPSVCKSLASRRALRVSASGLLAPVGKGTCNPPTACSSAANSRELGGDKSARARLDQSGGDCERRPFVAAGGARRHDLQDGAAGERRSARASKRKQRVAHESARFRARLTGAGWRANSRDEARAQILARSAKDKPILTEPAFLTVGNPPFPRRIAFRRRAPARRGLPGLVWLCGYRSEMDSTKATALDAEAERLGLSLLRFDYSGHGRSEGKLEGGTISRWLEEALAVIRAESKGPQILVGSSMGGYIALLAARALNKGKGGRVAGLVLIAPAVDMTEALLWEEMGAEGRRAILEEGVWRRPSPYSDDPDIFTRAMIEDGRKHLLMTGMIRTGCPVTVLQGMKDDAVPYAHALKLMERLGGDPATLTLVKDGDHRLSRPEDLALLFGAVERIVEAAKG